MADKFLQRLARVVPPRQGQQFAVACNTATSVIEFDTTIFQAPLAGGATGVPQSPASISPQLVRFVAEGADVWLLFGSVNTVSANSAATSGNTMAERLPVGTFQDFEISPTIDKFLSANTQNGTSLTGTLRYRLVSFPSDSPPGSG